MARHRLPDAFPSLLDAAGKLLTAAGTHMVTIAWMGYTINTVFMAATPALQNRRKGEIILLAA